MLNAIDEIACCNPGCDNLGKSGLNIVGHGWFATKSGRRRRYRCKVCGEARSTNAGTAYSGLRSTRREFDEVAGLRVEGVSISATARRETRTSAMQAGLVSKRLALSDIFTADGFPLGVFVAVVHVSVTVQLTESDALSAHCSPWTRKQAG